MAVFESIEVTRRISHPTKSIGDTWEQRSTEMKHNTSSGRYCCDEASKLGLDQRGRQSRWRNLPAAN
ncbi:unnamed protein product [Brassica oleracea var. botrytis]|uniref:Uncharacterized protein n=1 Tax=Brassica oleracea TaxID=3712 RepID=A0A3P6F011_BRAOL|nr:unnamed protein product [Brassica oleracea]